MAKVDVEECIRRACRRDPDALATLVRLYSPRLYGLFYRLTRSREAAEDLLQETFLRMVRTIGRYRHVGKFEAWLFRIAANLARDQARRRQRRGATMSWDEEAADGLAQELPQRVQDPDEHLTGDEIAGRLVAGLEKLSQTDREILLLRHYSGLSFREIAELLGVPVGTALARAHRALERLRAELGTQEP